MYLFLFLRFLYIHSSLYKNTFVTIVFSMNTTYLQDLLYLIACFGHLKQKFKNVR